MIHSTLYQLAQLRQNGAFGPHIQASLILIFSSLALIILPGAFAGLWNYYRNTHDASQSRPLRTRPEFVEQVTPFDHSRAA